MTVETRAPALLVGADQQVPLVTGGSTTYVNLDYAASTPPLAEVAQAVTEFAPWYSSVHRGTGFKSRVSTSAYEEARRSVGEFVGAGPEHQVILTGNTTSALNLVAQGLPSGIRVIFFEGEHHSNLLPWIAAGHKPFPVPATEADLLERIETELRATDGEALVAITGASNVTGEIWPIARVAELAHRYGARLLVDAAQLAPHRQVNMVGLGIDYLVLSAHKLYAPYGSGALVGRPDWFAATPPPIVGGGTARRVSTISPIEWGPLPDRLEAGSPNVIGAVAFAVACRVISAMDRAAAEHEEERLYEKLRGGLAQIPGIAFLDLWGEHHPHVGALSFTLEGIPTGLLAATLGAEHGIGVRQGAFCAHPLMAYITGGVTTACDPTEGGAVRASFGLGTTDAHIDALLAAVRHIQANGPSWTYSFDPEHGYDPSPDPRVWPTGLWAS